VGYFKDEFFTNIISIIVIAMCWAIRHPEGAKAALNDWSEEQRRNLLALFVDAEGGPEKALEDMSSTGSQGWEQMARDSVNIWDTAVGTANNPLSEFTDKQSIPDMSGSADRRTTFCSNCGKQASQASANFCISCGTRLLT
jgi:hypothetical protein